LFGLVVGGFSFSAQYGLMVQLQDFAGQGPVLFPDGIEVDAKDSGSSSHSTTLLPLRIYQNLTTDDSHKPGCLLKEGLKSGIHNC